MRRLFRPIKEGFIGFFRHFSVSLSSVAVVTFTMLFLAIILMINDNITQITKGIEQQIEIWVPVQPGEKYTIQAIENELKAMPHVKSVTLITKEAELEAYIKEYGSAYEFLREDNPLSDSFIVQADDGENLTAISSIIATKEWQTGIYDGGESTANLVQVLKGVRFGGSFLVVALMVLAVFLIANTIKLSIFSRQDEIEIMRIVGATNSFIRTPFLIEGFIIGLLGSVFPLVATYFGYNYILRNFSKGGALKLLQLSPIQPLYLIVFGVVLSVSIIVGLVGSYISVTKHLRLVR